MTLAGATDDDGDGVWLAETGVRDGEGVTDPETLVDGVVDSVTLADAVTELVTLTLTLPDPEEDGLALDDGEAVAELDVVTLLLTLMLGLTDGLALPDADTDGVRPTGGTDDDGGARSQRGRACVVSKRMTAKGSGLFAQREGSGRSAPAARGRQTGRHTRVPSYPQYWQHPSLTRRHGRGGHAAAAAR
jgi:hypothetical protein